MKIVILRDLKAKISLIIGFCVMTAFENQDGRYAVFAKVAPIKNEQVMK